ncbi:MAG: thioredoxin family protein [Zoogloeaceae bacterium]|jgi:peroxiredoxin|nr:thioredoxin family protein [Zoogloeaceae bacterium]
MVALNPPVCNFDWPAPDFSLPGVDGCSHTRASARGPRGLLVMFLCNHCPYVKAILDRLIRDCGDLRAEGIGSIAIMSNDAGAYPEDAFPNMKALAGRMDFPFPYVYDETQAIARAYDAVCTPDFFGFNADLRLQYRGRLDASQRKPAPPDARRELFEAMREIARTGRGPREQTASIGCSIKWRSGNESDTRETARKT